MSSNVVHHQTWHSGYFTYRSYLSLRAELSANERQESKQGILKVTRPYLFVFDRMQIVGDEMVSWNANSKKRPQDFAMAGPSKRPFQTLAPHEDEEL
jgi:hypothetical protein